MFEYLGQIGWIIVKMDFFLIHLFFVVLLTSYFVLSKPRGLPPGPPALPFFGCVSILRKLRSNRPHLVFHEAAKKYGNIVSIKIGRELMIILNCYDVIHQALVKQADSFSNRVNYLPAFKYLLKDGGGVLFQNYNHHWKILRRFTLQTLRDFGVGKSSIEDKIMTEIIAASKVLQETNGQPLIIAPLLQNIVGNVIYGIIFGHRYDYDDPDFEMVRNFTNVFVSGQGAVSLINYFPTWIVKLFSRKIDKPDLEREKVAEKINNFMLKKIKEHEETFDENNIRDFIDLYIKVSREDKDDTGDTFTKGNMLRVIHDLFLAGSETTSTTLDWALLYMIEHPEVQRRCQNEIDEVVGDKPTAYSDRVKLPYIDATIMEIQRLSNILPLSVPHSTSKDTELQGYKIPRKSIVIPLLYSVSLDPKYWTEPETFNPARFIDMSGKLIKNDAFIPFSAGPRTCLGEPLARMELFLGFSNLLQRFTFYKEEKTIKHSMKPKTTQVTNAPLEYKIRARKR